MVLWYIYILSMVYKPTYNWGGTILHSHIMTFLKVLEQLEGSWTKVLILPLGDWNFWMFIGLLVL